MKPATQAMEWRASTSRLRPNRCMASPSVPSVLTPATSNVLVSGVEAPATIQTAPSRPTLIATAHSSHARSTDQGSRFQRSSAARVSAHPWTRARSFGFIPVGSAVGPSGLN
jgi:hypothetical protein